MHTASREWRDRVAAWNAVEVTKGRRRWQPDLEWYGPRGGAEAAACGRGAADVPLSAAGREARPVAPGAAGREARPVAPGAAGKEAR